MSEDIELWFIGFVGVDGRIAVVELPKKFSVEAWEALDSYLIDEPRPDLDFDSEDMGLYRFQLKVEDGFEDEDEWGFSIDNWQKVLSPSEEKCARYENLAKTRLESVHRLENILDCNSSPMTTSLEKKCAKYGEVIKLAKEVTDGIREEPCRYDHNRNCQEHLWFGLEGDDCPVSKLDKAFRALEPRTEKEG